MEEAIEFLFANPDFQPPKKKGGGFGASLTSWLKGSDPDEALARQLHEEEKALSKSKGGLRKSQESVLSVGETNFFVGSFLFPPPPPNAFHSIG